MLLRSMKNKNKKSTTAPRVDFAEPSSSSTASVFSSVLDIILLAQKAGSTQLITSESQKALRLTCKPARSVVDAHVIKLRMLVPATNLEDFTNCSKLFSWPWPNLMEVDLTGFVIPQGHMNAFVALRLPQLKNLTIWCRNPRPLSRSNWPELESLELNVLNNETPAENIYPGDFQLPRWPLKKLDLAVENWEKIDFFPALLKNCEALESLKFCAFDFCTAMTTKAASMLTSEPFMQLEELIFHIRDVEEGFLTAFFGREWPGLKRFSFASPAAALILPLIASKTWFSNLESLEIVNSIPGTQLNVALKALSSSIKTLTFHCLRCSVLPEAFEGVKFDNLECLKLEDLLPYNENNDYISEVSEYIIALFDNSCATPTFPKLSKLSIRVKLENVDDVDLWNPPEWEEAPIKSILEQCPALKQMSISGLTIGHDVLLYLGKFRKVTGGSIEINYSCVAVFHLSLARQAYLETLDINEETWDNFCTNEAGPDDFMDCRCFNCMSDLRFRRLTDALKHGTDIPEDSELDRSGMEESELQPIYGVYKIVV